MDLARYISAACRGELDAALAALQGDADACAPPRLDILALPLHVARLVLRCPRMAAPCWPPPTATRRCSRGRVPAARSLAALSRSCREVCSWLSWTSCLRACGVILLPPWRRQLFSLPAAPPQWAARARL